MKNALQFLVLYFISITCFSQVSKKGTVVRQKFTAASIQGNPGGEDPVRSLTIYLPPGYETSTRRYPTIYFLHGYLLNDSLMMAFNQFEPILDTAIMKGELPPMILVLPNSQTTYGGSMYTNSSLTGNWADYIGKDVVAYVDKHFRTISNRNSRGLAGHSMGGYGALKCGMLYPDVFGAVYSMSPGMLNWGPGINLQDTMFRKMERFKNEFSDAQITGDLFQGRPGFLEKFYTKLFADLARTYSPAPGKNFISGDLPVTYSGDSMVVNAAVVAKWEANFPINMIESHVAALKSLIALKIDWGRYDEVPHVPPTSAAFSKKLDAYKINHFAEEYNGGHIDKLTGTAGRYYTDMLPFFKKYLKQ